MKKIFTVPNILTFFRIVLIPFILWMFLIKKRLVSAILLLVSAATDIVDGFIARRFNMVSPLGKALDPIADKSTVMAVIVCLCFVNKLMIILVAIFGLKEFIMGIEGLIIIEKTGTSYSARWYGKVTTAFLYLTMFAVILWSDMPKALYLSLIIACSSVVTASLVMYSVDNARYLKEFREKAREEAEIAEINEEA